MRKLHTGVLVLALLVGSFWLRPGPAVSVGTSFVFPLSVKGTARQTDLAFGPGTKITPDKINDKILGAILRGENTSAYSAQFLDVLHSDPSGRFFLFFDGRGADGSTSWRFATNPNGTMATTVHGAIAQDGFFWLAGQYTLPVLGTMADVFFEGRVKFAKGTFDPVKINGTFNLVSVAAGEGITLKFKTVGAPTQQ